MSDFSTWSRCPGCGGRFSENDGMCCVPCSGCDVYGDWQYCDLCEQYHCWECMCSEESMMNHEEASDTVLNGHIEDIRGWVIGNDIESLKFWLRQTLELDDMSAEEIETEFGSYFK